MQNSARRSPPDYPVPGLSGTARWRSRQWCGTAMRLPIVSAHIDPLPSIRRQAPAPAAVIVAGVVIGRAEDGEAAEVIVTEDAVVTVPAGAGKARPDRGMRKARPAEGRAAETCAAHPADMH